MHPFRAITLLFALALSALAWAADPPGLMHLAEPVDTSWIKTGVKIPAPPKDKGLTVSVKSLKASAPLSFSGNDSLAAEAAKPKGVVTGKGTKESPYVISKLAFRGLTDKDGLTLLNITAPLIVENILCEGIPVSPRDPSRAQGINLDRCNDTVIRHCQVSRCAGIQGSNCERVLFEDNFLYSTDTGIFTLQGSHCTGRGNYVRDSARYGVFLYNGPYHTIENNYIIFTAREGIGTNGTGHHAIYRNNIIIHTGWTAVNVEGSVDGAIVENNLVVETFYGIILEGNNTVTKHNRVYNCSQAGIIIIGFVQSEFGNVKIVDNEVYNTAAVGIDVMAYTYDITVARNKVWQSDSGINIAGKNCVIEDNDIYHFMSGINISAPGCKLLNNKIYQGRNPINIGASSDTIITGNNIHNSLQGVTVGAAKNVLVEGNTFDTSGGVDLKGSTEVTIRKNSITRVPYECLYITNSTKCIAEDNIINSGDCCAVWVNGGSANIIRNNTIADYRAMWGYGAVMLENTKDNIFSGNTFTRNGTAILLRDAASTGNIFEKNIYKDNPALLSPAENLADFIKNNTIEEALAKK